MKTKLIFLFFLLWFLAGCSSPLRVYTLPGHGYYPPVAPDSVQLLRHEPDRPHFAFAEIRYHPSPGMSRYEVERQMRLRGAEIGAHALVLEVDNVYRERVWVGPYRTHRRVYRDRVMVGIAIRYQ